MSLQFCWTGGAGLLIRCDGEALGIDLYFSNSCMTPEGQFKRMIPPPWEPEKTEVDYLVCSHEHGDHMDTESIPLWLSQNQNRIIAGPDSVTEICKSTVSKKQICSLNRGDTIHLGKFTVKGVFCDHGDLSPDAIGVVVEVLNRRIYFTGDMTFRRDFAQISGISDVDLLVVPINGKYGNPDSVQAAEMTSILAPRIVMPCHYWMFMEHGGDPASFAKACKATAPSTECIISAVGEWQNL